MLPVNTTAIPVDARDGVTNGNNQLTQDKDGYFLINLGGVNIHNNKNGFYRLKDPSLLLGEGDLKDNPFRMFLGMLKNGYVLGEHDHPKFEPTMNIMTYMERFKSIPRNRASHTIKYPLILKPLDEETKVPGAGQPTRIMGWVKPILGPFGESLRNQLLDPAVNVAFSIRSITKPAGKSDGVEILDLVDIITFDWVNSPGIAAANKFSTLRGESGSDIAIDIPDEILEQSKEIDLDAVVADIYTHMDQGVLSCESGEDLLRYVTQLKANLGISASSVKRKKFYHTW